MRVMRTFFGIILGVLIAIGGAYLHDVSAGSGPAAEKMVNWNVVSARWASLTGQAQQLASNMQQKLSETTNTR
jgi:hypothetical protein